MDISLLEETIMLYTETKELQKYRDSKRLWQGIPSIEVTKRGRIFLTFYSGGVKEEIGNLTKTEIPFMKLMVQEI